MKHFLKSFDALDTTTQRFFIFKEAEKVMEAVVGDQEEENKLKDEDNKLNADNSKTNYQSGQVVIMPCIL